MERCVLAVLADACNRQGLAAFPSHKTIGSKVSATRRTVQRVLARLVETGWIEDSGDRVGYRSSTVSWRLCIPEGIPAAAWREHWSNEEPDTGHHVPPSDPKTGHHVPSPDSEMGNHVPSSDPEVGHSDTDVGHSEQVDGTLTTNAPYIGTSQVPRQGTSAAPAALAHIDPSWELVCTFWCYPDTDDDGKRTKSGEAHARLIGKFLSDTGHPDADEILRRLAVGFSRFGHWSRGFPTFNDFRNRWNECNQAADPDLVARLKAYARDQYAAKANGVSGDNMTEMFRDMEARR
jgi:hypothetical protein